MLFKRVLITGANGLVGQELVQLMSRHPEYDVLATARDAAPRYGHASCGYTPLDVTNPTDVRNLFQDFTTEVVLHCAAMTQVDQCEAERDARHEGEGGTGSIVHREASVSGWCAKEYGDRTSATWVG